MTDPIFQRRLAKAPHSFELLTGGTVVARLEWRQDPTNRRDAGWWYSRLRPARAPRRLRVDPAIDDLSADRDRADAQWCEDADSLAMLTTEAALARAEKLLTGRLAPRNESEGAEPPGEHEILVTGIDAVTVAVALPSSVIFERNDMVVISDRFDERSLRTALRRLGLLGAEVVAVLRTG